MASIKIQTIITFSVVAVIKGLRQLQISHVPFAHRFDFYISSSDIKKNSYILFISLLSLPDVVLVSHHYLGHLSKT